MNQDIQKIMIFGDSHLSSRNRGFHLDYPKESMYYFQEQTREGYKLKADVMIGLGDLTYGSFDLSYRKQFEEELEKQLQITGGRRYEIKGNHDRDKNITEYEFYNQSGRLKGSKEYQEELQEILLQQGVYLTFVNYDEVHQYKHHRRDGVLNIVLVHGTITFTEDGLPAYLTKHRLLIQNNPNWWGIDYIICGHIHNPMNLDGYVVHPSGESFYKTKIIYPGCPCRTAFNTKRDHEGNLKDEFTHFYRVIVEKVEDGSWKVNALPYEMLPLEDCIQLSVIEKNQERENVLQLNDIVQQINNGTFEIVDYEETIYNQSALPMEIRQRAIELLRQARAEV